MNLTQAGLGTSFNQDIINRQLSNAAVTNVSFDPTSKAKVSAHETDKQAEDNATWYFEYKALLNSKLTTLITSLTSAYTTDMDAAMGADDPIWDVGGKKNAMQGLTGAKKPPAGSGLTILDPGATRALYAYMQKFNSNVTVSTPASSWAGDSGTNPSAPADGEDVVVASTNTTVYGIPAASNTTLTNYVNGGAFSGTTTFMSGGKKDFVIDALKINMDPYNSPINPVDSNASGVLTPATATQQTLANMNYFSTTKSALSNIDLYSGDSAGTNDPLKDLRKIGNNVELTLYKFLNKPENLDIIRFGLFKDVYVVGTSSLPTGSQIQGSLSMDWDSVNGLVKIKQERFAAFFHS